MAEENRRTTAGKDELLLLRQSRANQETHRMLVGGRFKISIAGFPAWAIRFPFCRIPWGSDSAPKLGRSSYPLDGWGLQGERQGGLRCSMEGTRLAMHRKSFEQVGKRAEWA